MKISLNNPPKIKKPDNKTKLEILPSVADFTASNHKEVSEKLTEQSINTVDTHFSIEQDNKEIIDKILDLRDKLPKEVVEEIFKKYGSFMDQVNLADDFINKEFKENLLGDKNDLNKLKENLFVKAKNLLVYYLNKLENSDVNINKLISEIENLNVEKELFLSVLKLTKKTGNKLTIEDINSLELIKMEPSDFLLAEEYVKNPEKYKFSDEEIKKNEGIISDKEEIRKIYKENYADNEELQGLLVQDTVDVMNLGYEYAKKKNILAGATEIFVLKYKGKVVSFNRFDLTTGSKFYFKSFNVDKDFNGSGIGCLMTQATLDKKAKEKTILADCSAVKPISSFYIENGFVARKFYSFKNEPSLSLIRSDKILSKEFKTMKLSIEDIMLNKNIPEGVIIKKAQKQEECDFDLLVPENFELPKNWPPNKPSPEKYVLTRYFFNKESKEWITVFEPLQRDLEDFV